MHALRRLSAARRGLLFALFAVALAVRALVPGGWMVAAGADGSARLVLCSGIGPIGTPAQAAADRAMAAAMPGMAHHDDAPPTHADHPCAFAGLGLPSDVASFDLPVPPRRIVALADLQRGRSVAIGRGLAAPPPPATGPPAFA